MNTFLVRSLRLLVVLVLAVGALACKEDIETGSGCPLLCPNQELPLNEIFLDAITVDVSVEHFPPLGTASYFLLAASGDSLDGGFVVRFDSLPTTYSSGGNQIDITDVDSAYVRITVDTNVTFARAAVTIEAYDVDTTAADGDFAAVRALFRPDRLIGSATFQPDALEDTLAIPVSNDFIEEQIQAEGGRLRVGFRVRSDSTVRLTVLTANQPRYPRLKFDPAPADTDVPITEVPPRSLSPTDDPLLAIAYTDYSLYFAGPIALRESTEGGDVGVFQDSVLAVGGLATRRLYFKFDVPDSILNSSIIRATLLLNKRPTPTYGIEDTVAVIPVAVFATHSIPVSKAVVLSDSLNFFPMPSNRALPSDAGERAFEIVTFARSWTPDNREQLPQAIALRVGQEGRILHEIQYYSTSAPAALRPRLRILYTPRSRFGLP